MTPREFIVKELEAYKGLEDKVIPDTAHLADDLGMDSLEIVDLQLRIADKFPGCEDLDLSLDDTVGTILTKIDNLTNKK